MSNKKIPHFIIVGTMKSGTTTLLFHLRNHTKIHLPNKELHFFNKEENYSKGEEWYQEELRKDMQEGTKIVGEKTPTYSFQPNVAKRIAKMNPNAKIIWMFRNPVDRAYSNYPHAVKRGLDYTPFKKAVEQDEIRKEKNIFLAYLSRSYYQDQVQRFLNLFPSENMYYMVFEDLIKHPEKEMAALFKFLGVKYEDFELKIEYRNKTVLPYFPKLLYYSRRLFGLKSIFHKAFIKLNFLNNKKPYPKLNPKLRKKLIQKFEAHNQSFSELINKDLSSWNN